MAFKHPSFCTPTSEVAMLFFWSLSRLPFLRQVIDLDLLLFTAFNLEHVDLFLCPTFTQRPMNDKKIELNKEHIVGQYQFFANFIENDVA